MARPLARGSANLTQLLREHPHVDRQKLRQLLKRVTSADSATANEVPSPAQKKAARAISVFYEQLETPTHLGLCSTNDNFIDLKGGLTYPYRHRLTIFATNTYSGIQTKVITP